MHNIYIIKYFIKDTKLNSSPLNRVSWQQNARIKMFNSDHSKKLKLFGDSSTIWKLTDFFFVNSETIFQILCSLAAFVLNFMLVGNFLYSTSKEK